MRAPPVVGSPAPLSVLGSLAAEPEPHVPVPIWTSAVNAVRPGSYPRSTPPLPENPFDAMLPVPMRPPGLGLRPVFLRQWHCQLMTLVLPCTCIPTRRSTLTLPVRRSAARRQDPALHRLEPNPLPLDGESRSVARVPPDIVTLLTRHSSNSARAR